MRTMGYSLPRKNHWRRWQWNRIVERLSMLRTKPRDAVVLYLAGQEDLDRKEALLRGFKPHNLIAVESDTETVRALRGKGVNVINAPLHEVALAWPEVHVIVADLCCGFDIRALRLVYALTHAITAKRTVLSVNLQRGRDPYLIKQQRIAESELGTAFPTLHRGKVFLEAINYGFGDNKRRVFSMCTNSYRSKGSLYFDSGVAVLDRCVPLEPRSPATAIARKVAAAKAIRTVKVKDVNSRRAA